MRIQLNSDKNIVVDAQFTQVIDRQVNRVLKPFTSRLTRVEVHLSDVNSHKSGALDKRCLIEARPARHRPLTATGRATTIEEAVKGALSKLRSSLQTFYGRMTQPKKKAVSRSTKPKPNVM